jgi:ribose/xylose/arabinose/galactoside ABC-type transport system permease subunit
VLDTDCELASIYMMKFMDGVITDEEAAQLNKHILTCKRCREDFIMYDQIMREFTKITLTEAPTDLEEKVMARIRCIPAQVTALPSERVLYGIWGVVSVLIAFGLIIGMNKDYLLNALSANSFFAPLVSFFTTASYVVSDYSTGVTDSFRYFLTQINHFAYHYQIIFLVAAVLLASVQVFLYRKKDAIEKVDAE